LALAEAVFPLMSAQQFVVDRLNEPPFNMRLTLVAFDEKSPFELLEIVNAIMAQLSTDHQIDLRDETPDSTANRMTDFLKVLNFKQQLDKQTFKQALLHGDPGVIYPILTWMLQRLPELQKRTYLAKFLMNIEIPEHMFADEEMSEVYQQLKDLQEEFKETHKTSEKFKSQVWRPYPNPNLTLTLTLTLTRTRTRTLTLTLTLTLTATLTPYP
jgi:intraflagellar transport protein 81